LKKALDLIETQSFTLIPQDDSKVSLAPRLKKEDGLIDWRKSAPEIINQIRGMSPWPGTFTYYKGRVLKIDEAKLQIPSSVETCRPAPGQIQGVSKKGIVVSTAEGNLLIERLQPEGRRKMTAAEFVAGHRISAGERLGEK
ncbi:MAG: methionyl-tRNA formyltransferase, partial [Candidatus Omnitrophica bacterium]|nr:methionyl-tRNA formyltransferase [Candidatus Omnitrophota bacterium]